MRWLLKKHKRDKSEEKRITDVVHRELEGYVTREDVKKMLGDIQSDDNKRHIWAGLSTRKKMALMRRMIKGEK